MTATAPLSQQKIDILRSGQQFDDIAAEISQLLDVLPSGITQESVWLHLKKIGQKASVDQIRITLDKLTQRGELMDAKNGKNETVWKRARKPGVNITVHNVEPLRDALKEVGDQARHGLEQSVKKAMANLRTVERAGNDAATRERVNDIAVATAATESKAVTASAAAVAPTEPATDAAHSEQEAGAAPTPAQAPPITTLTPEISTMPTSQEALDVIATASTKATQSSSKGDRIDLAILQALADTRLSRKSLMQICACSGTGADAALERLAHRKLISREPGRRGLYGLLKQPLGSSMVQTWPAATQRKPAAKPKASPKPKAPQAAKADLEPSLAQFVARLQPVDRLPQKIQALDQLITVMPPPIAEHLRAIRADFVRLAGA